MRPYLAIIKDSFREAFVSRVLWIVLILLSLVLLTAFPLSYQFFLTTEFSRQDIVDENSILTTIRDSLSKVEDVATDDPSLMAELGSLISAENRKEIEKELGANNAQTPDGEDDQSSPAKNTVNERDDFRRKQEKTLRRQNLARKILNQLIVEQDLASLSAVVPDDLLPEAKSLAESRTRSTEETQRLNRLILEQVFEAELRSGPPTSIVFYYLGMEIPGKFPIEKERLIYSVRAFIKYGLNFVFNTIGILMALIITANIIPQTFDPGSLSLLLSKPISRWKLFIAQFVGGCAFVTLTMAFFFTGVWLFLGSRMGYWNVRLLLYIPSFIGIFAVYYSASAVAGVIWRSPIVSVVAGASLWLLTFVGFLVNLFCEASFNNVAFESLDVYKKQVLVAFVPDNDESVNQWDPESGDWIDISEGVSSRLGLAMGPIFDPELNVVLGVRQRIVMRPFGPPVAGKSELLSLDMNNKKSGFLLQDIGLSSVRRIFRRNDGRLLLLAGGRLHLLQRDKEIKPASNAPQEGGDSVASRSTTLKAKTLGPERSVRTGGLGTAIAFNPLNDSFAVIRRGKVTVYSQNSEGEYEMKNQVVLEQLKGGDVELAFNGNTLVVFHATGGVTSFDANTMQPKTVFPDSKTFVPTSVVASRDGKWIAALRKNETAWIYSVENDSLELCPFSREAKAIAFDDENAFYIADRWLQIMKISLAESSIKSRLQGNLTTFQSIYKGIIYPVYFLIPKWGELNYTVEYLITGSETSDTFATSILKIMNVDRIVPFPLETYNLRPWPQVWNALGFICFMLAVGCLIIEKTDY